MALRLGVCRVSNVGVVAGSACALLSNGTARSAAVFSNTVTCNTLVCNALSCMTLNTTSSIACNTLSCSNNFTANTVNFRTAIGNALQCGNILATNVTCSNLGVSIATCGNVVASNVACSNLAVNSILCGSIVGTSFACSGLGATNIQCSNVMVSSGMNLPNAASFTGEYAELSDTPLAACYSNNALTYNMKTYAASGVSAGLTGKATFYATTNGVNTGPAMFSNIISIQLTPYYPSAAGFSTVISCITSVSTDNKTIVAYGATNGAAVPAGTRFYLLVHGV